MIDVDLSPDRPRRDAAAAGTTNAYTWVALR
jgi:hypothetical protein